MDPMIEKFNLAALYPEILLVVMTIAIAMIDLFVKSPRRTLTYALSLLTMAVVAVLQAHDAMSGTTVYSFGNMVVSDPMGNWLKCFSTLAVFVTLVYGRPYAADRDMLKFGGELFTLGLFALLGMYVMISGNNFLVLYLGVELLALSSYALVALRRDSTTASEAAMKYFVLGALGSGFLLYGMSMIYGGTGSLDITTVFKAVASGQINHKVLILGLVFLVCGLGFKFGVVPFHMWVPDVYQGAPTVVTLMIGGAHKLAAFAMTMRLLVEGLMPLAIDWQQMLMVLSVASLLIGNLAGIAQTNMKRMIAFSTISQMGFVLIGLYSGVVNGDTAAAANAYSSAMFYVVTYVLTTLAVFGIIMLLAREGFESEEIADFSGLNQRSPLYAGVMALCMFSLAGIPPMVGFAGKLSVLQALVASGQPGAIALATYAVLMSLLAAFYYLRVVKVMYFDAPLTASTVSAGADVRMVLLVNSGLLLVLGLLPGGLMTLCANAVISTLGS
jgi:NADH-quinone oxidoreductase subunit N